MIYYHKNKIFPKCNFAMQYIAQEQWIIWGTVGDPISRSSYWVINHSTTIRPKLNPVYLENM